MNKTEHRSVRIITATLLFMITLTATTPFGGAIGWSSPNGDPLTTDPVSWDMTPSIMQTRNGTIWVVFSSDRNGFQYDLYRKTSYDGGSSWSANARRLTWHSGVDENPSVMQAWNGTIWLVWASDRTGNKEIYYKTSSNGGFSWSPNRQLTNNASKDNNPSITQNIDGKIWIVWHRVEAGNYNILCTSSSDNGQSWSSETHLTTHPNVDMQPSITHTSNGTLWVVWQSYRFASNYELVYKTSYDGGSTWSANAARLTTDEAKADESPSVIQDVNGTLWVVWSKAEEIWYKTLNFGSPWSSESSLAKSGGDDMNPSVINTKDRRIWVVWESTRSDYDIYYIFSDPISIAHDIAVINVNAWGDLGFTVTWVPRGVPININVTIENQGTFQENFNVTVYADRNVGDERAYNETQTGIILNAGANTTLTFTWDTLNSSYGTYYISANATVVEGEYDTFDNVMLHGSKIGGITVPFQPHNIDIVAMLAPLALVILFVSALGAIGVLFFRFLMSIRPRWQWPLSKRILQTRCAFSGHVKRHSDTYTRIAAAGIIPATCL